VLWAAKKRNLGGGSFLNNNNVFPDLLRFMSLHESVFLAATISPIPPCLARQYPAHSATAEAMSIFFPNRGRNSFEPGPRCSHSPAREISKASWQSTSSTPLAGLGAVVQDPQPEILAVGVQGEFLRTRARNTPLTFDMGRLCPCVPRSNLDNSEHDKGAPCDMIDQPAQDSFQHWLYTNAPAAWISAR
jgi:hypothetical protein